MFPSDGEETQDDDHVSHEVTDVTLQETMGGLKLCFCLCWCTMLQPTH